MSKSLQSSKLIADNYLWRVCNHQVRLIDIACCWVPGIQTHFSIRGQTVLEPPCCKISF
ncbi:hypothetical protein BVRB_4g071940 [Beta vulgaris subsp. vulgaris]|nr:hypothetical protein BVRB_4g071940 [Beta vulgaris subsp. vulgaris]